MGCSHSSDNRRGGGGGVIPPPQRHHHHHPTSSYMGALVHVKNVDELAFSRGAHPSDRLAAASNGSSSGSGLHKSSEAVSRPPNPLDPASQEHFVAFSNPSVHTGVAPTTPSSAAASIPPASVSLASPGESPTHRPGSSAVGNAVRKHPSLGLPPRALTPSRFSRHSLCESMLSDITISDVSANTASLQSPSSMSNVNAHSSYKHSRGSSVFPFFTKGEDLEQQRQQAPLNIEEDLFIYDDIVISKDEARTKHWRLEGRKAGRSVDFTSSTSLSSKHSSIVGRKLFTFTDFAVCVDEMDVQPLTGQDESPLGLLSERQSIVNMSVVNSDDPAAMDACALIPAIDNSSISLGSAPSTQKCGKLFFTVTSSVQSAPNTAAAFEQRGRREAAAAWTSRQLRDMSCDTIIGHSTRVKCIAVSPSEKDYASCNNEDASVMLTNLSLKEEVGIFTGHQDTVINATFSPDGKYLATTSKDKTMILWDVMTTKLLLTFRHAKVVICCCFSPDSKYIASGCQDRVCRVWDTRRGREWVSYTHHEGIIISIAPSPDGSYICSASADKTLRVWSSTSGKTRFTLVGHVGIILSCSYTTDGRYIVSNDETLLRVWSTEDGTCTLSLSPAAVTGATHLTAHGPRIGWTLSAAAPGGFLNYVVVACNNRFVYVLDLETGAEVTSLYCKAPVYCLATGSHSIVACGDSFGNVYMLTMK